jgi:hypothetical protein
MELQHRGRVQAHRSTADRVPLWWRSDGATDRLTFDADGADPGDAAELLRDAAIVVAARQQLDVLLVQLAAQPFSHTACARSAVDLETTADRAQAAYRRVCSAPSVRVS